MRTTARLVLSVSCVLGWAGVSRAMDPGALSAIAPVVSTVRNADGVTFTCADRSQVRVFLLAPDLARVRVSVRAPLPERDHSWAVAKTSWETPRWSLAEDTASVRLATDELEVVVRRAPLLVEFRDPRTHAVINADSRPMSFDPGGAGVAAMKALGADEHFYGLGEKAARLDKRRGSFEMWNTDHPAYKEGTDPIYQSIPFYIGLRGGEAYGIFFDNSYRSHFDFGSSGQEYAAFSAEGGAMDYYFFRGPAIKAILSRYADLTGHMPLPPLWALGHQQSRWSYYPDSLAEEIVRRYRAEDLPLDVLHLDIHYMDGYRVFTWDPSRFPDPAGFVGRLRRQGVKTVVIVDPGVKYQPVGPERYSVYDQGAKQGFFLKRKDGRVYVGKVWPGESVFVDYTLPAAARWWGDLHRAYLDAGVAGIWNDMNEPADFVDQTGAAQADVVSYDEGERSPHAKNRNVFALLEASATFHGLQRLAPDQRPYLITRAGSAGIQRYATMWTGDNSSTWADLALSLPMLETLGLSGEPFAGTDTGGFNGRADGELLARWYQVSFLTPFCRNHKVIDGYDQEPWRFGPYYEDIIRKYLKLRYRLLPFLYTVLEQAHRTGAPWLRPLLLDYQGDPNVATIDDEFLVGGDLLAAPVLAAGRTARPVYLPAGSWYDYWTGERLGGGRMIQAEAPLEKVPLFVRGGAVIPMGPEMAFVGEKAADPLTLEIYPDETGQASGAWYEDDGTSPAYEQGAFRRTSVAVSRVKDVWEIAVGAPQGRYTPAPRRLVFALRTGAPVRRVWLDGSALASAAGPGAGSGWLWDGRVLSVSLRDDGRAHRVTAR